MKNKSRSTSTVVLFAVIALLVGTLAFASMMPLSIQSQLAAVFEALSSFFTVEENAM